MDENGIIDTVGSFVSWTQKSMYDDPEDRLSPQEEAAKRALNRQRVDAGKNIKRITPFRGEGYDKQLADKRKTGNQGLIEDMQKGHLQGCVCETCGSASSWADKHADDSSRDATDRQGRPTLGHTGHGHAVAILISRMHRKARSKEKQYDRYELSRRGQAEAARIRGEHGESARLIEEAKDDPDVRQWLGARQSYRGLGEMHPEQWGSRRQAPSPLTSSRTSVNRPEVARTGTTSRGVRQEGDRRKASQVNYGGRVPKPDKHKNIDRTTIRGDRGTQVENMEKAVYEYINKAYKVPSKEELAAAADKRKEKAIADAKERYGESFTPKDTSQRRKRKYVPAAPAAADRRTAAQDAWRKANPGQPDPESFSNMLKALLKFVSMTPPKPKSGNTGTPAVPNQPAGSDDGTKPPDVEPDPEPEEEVTQTQPKDNSKSWLSRKDGAGSLVGDLVRTAQDIAGVRHGQPKEAMQNMEKQELEWVTPQVETPLHKFLDYNNQRGS